MVWGNRNGQVYAVIVLQVSDDPAQGISVETQCLRRTDIPSQAAFDATVSRFLGKEIYMHACHLFYPYIRAI